MSWSSSTQLLRQWQSLDRAELACQYDNRAAVPQHPAIFRRWSEHSAAFRRSHSYASLDLRYGADPRQRIDLFLPAEPKLGGPRAGPPLLIYLHGGYWQSLSKSDFSFVASGPSQRGFAVAVVGYRLCPQVSLAEIVQDARSAALYLWRQGPVLGLDRSRIVAAGHSAGAHLAAMLLTIQWQQFGKRTAAELICGGLGISGLYQLEALVETPVNEAIGLDSARAVRLSPVALEPAYACVMLTAVGAAESDEYRRQSECLAALWPSLGAAIDHLELAGHDHFTIVDELAEADGSLCRLLPSLLTVAGTETVV